MFHTSVILQMILIIHKTSLFVEQCWATIHTQKVYKYERVWTRINKAINGKDNLINNV